MIYQNPLDKTGEAAKLGEEAEQEFLRLALAHRWHIRHSIKEQDMHQHWDFLVSYNAKGYRVEVKGMKKISRRDGKPQDKLVWVELHGVADKGWLYGSKAEIIAFEITTGFILVFRTDLITLVEQLVDTSKLVENPEDALYCTYKRKDRNDLVALIKTEDLKRICFRFWWKDTTKKDIYGILCS